MGAGVAGLYCAWRLLEQQPTRRVVVVERLPRTGGRLESDLIKIHSQVIHEEEGGMRFNGGMPELIKVLRAMDLCGDITPFPMVDPSQNNRRYLRGRSFTVAEAERDRNQIWGQLYALNADERGRDPLDVLGAAFTRVLTANGADPTSTPRTPEFWQRLRTRFHWKDVPLNRWPLWGLLGDLGVSEECITLLGQIAGFEAPFRAPANAGAAFQILEDFSGQPQFYTMKRGFSRLPDALAARVQALAGHIMLGAEAKVLARADEFTLGVETSAGSRVQLTAPQVILALPAGPLQQLLQASPSLTGGAHGRQLGVDAASVCGLQMLKLVFYYDHAWWGEQSVNRSPFLVGPSFTDLPVNTVYPFLAVTGDAVTGPAALTVYCDFAKVNYWRGLQGVGPRFASPFQREHADGPHALTAASQATVAAAGEQFARAFDARQIPAPVLTSYRCWSDDDPFGAAYHLWSLGVDDAAVTQRMVEPLTGLFVANEAWSDMQGWVNGALRSADLVLARFGITPLAADAARPTCDLPLQPPKSAR